MNRTVPIPLSQVIYALAFAGAETLAGRLVIGLNRGGRYACSVYAVYFDGPLSGLLAAQGIPSQALFRAGKWDLKPLLRLVKEFRAKGTRIVHTHSMAQLLYGGTAARLVGAKVVHTEHDFYSLRTPRAQRLLRRLTRMAHRVTAVAEPVREFLRDSVGIPERKLVTIQNGVDVARFESAKPLDRSRVGCTDREFVIGCVARLSREKGHAVLLEAFQRMHAVHPNARLLLIGEGEEGVRLKASADRLGLNGAVRFLGLREDVPELLATCDAVVLPSLEEGFPMVLLEAMAAGKAVVATQVGAIPGLIRAGDTGMLVPPGDPTALADAMSWLLDDASLRRRLGGRGQALVRDTFGFDKTISQYDQVYQAVLSNDRGHRCDSRPLRKSSDGDSL